MYYGRPERSYLCSLDNHGLCPGYLFRYRSYVTKEMVDRPCHCGCHTRKVV